MEVLLCAATAFEIQPTIEFIRQQGLEQEVELIITGVGLVAATHAITMGIAKHAPGLILQGGIAGSFDASLPLGTVVTVSSDTFGDLGVEEEGGFQSVFDLNLAHPDKLPWNNGALRNPNLLLLQSFGIPVVEGVSVQEISTHPRRIERLKGICPTGIETMEGAALHYVALMEGVNFAQIRAVSNYVGERDKKAWKLKESIKSLNVHLQEILIKKLKS